MEGPSIGTQPLTGNYDALSKVKAKFDTDHSGTISLGEVMKTADTNHDGKLSTKEKDALAKQITELTGDANLATQITAFAGQVNKMKFDANVKGPELKPTVDMKDQKLDFMGADEFSINNSPADPPTILKDGASIGMNKGVTLSDVDDQGNWTPPAVQYTDPTDNQVKTGTLVRFSTGDSYVVPQGKEVNISPNDQSGFPPPSSYKLNGDGSSYEMRARYSAIFCTRSVRV